MKKSYFLFALLALFFVKPVFAQSVKNLDEKNGFKKFKFGMDYIQFEKELQYVDKIQDHHLFYLYIGSEYDNLLGVEWKEMYLSFYKNKLVNIEIIFDNFDITLEHLLANLSKAFGKPVVGENKDNFGKKTKEYICSWTGEKVGMNLAQENKEDEIKELRGQVYVKIMPLDANEKINLGEF